MKKSIFSKFVRVVAMATISVFFLTGCAEDPANNNGGGGGGGGGNVDDPSNGGGGIIQASCPDAATTPVDAEGIGSVFCGGKTYKTIKIGEQVWMAENLNYNTNGSRCYGDKTGGDSQNKCDIYGRLYNWATAMKVCPSDWHLPSDDEWAELITTTGNSSSKLKSATGWSVTNYGSGGNGTNDYGFTALPGGGGGYPLFDFFQDVGTQGWWWSATEYYVAPNNAPYSYAIEISSSHPSYKNFNAKDLLYSVRCVQN